MTLEEAKKAVAEIRSQGTDDEMALATFFTMFKDGKLDYEQFEMFAALVGYELTDEFKNMSDEERKGIDIFAEGEGEDEEDEDYDFPGSKRDVAKLFSSDEDDEDDEEDKAMKLFGK